MLPSSPPSGPVNSGVSSSRRSLMTADAIVSDLRISTWLSTIPVSIGVSVPAAACVCRPCILRLSMINSAVLVYRFGAVSR